MCPTPTRAVAGFSAWAATYDQTIAKEVEQYSGMPYAEVLRRVCEAADLPPNAQVLDIGTGTGALALLLAQQAEDTCVLGVDPTEAMLQRAHENALRSGLGDRVRFRQAAAEALPFPDESFDIVVSSIAMHHTVVRQSLSEIARVLKPGGRVVIADMARNAKWESTLGVFLTPMLALYYLLSKRSWKIARAELAAYRQLFLKDEWEEMLCEASLRGGTVQAYQHPTSEWYPGVLFIMASKER